MIGKIINGFEIQAEIGEGGMATVYLAKNKLGKKAAIKIMHSNLLNNEQVVTRFDAEARIMLKLEHPNIRQVYDLTEIEGTPVIIMEYLEGQSLKEYITKHHAVDENTINKWLTQLLNAFEFFHKKNIIHRDIKPGNIFITTQNQIKIVDFGIAKSDSGNVNTITGQMLGSPNYMSPEQIKNPKAVGKETDYYSLGITLLHAATGKLPYSNLTSTFEIQTKIVSQDIPEIPSSISINLTRLIEELCHKEPKQRTINSNRLLSIAQSADKSYVEDIPKKDIPTQDKTLVERHSPNTSKPRNEYSQPDKTIIEEPKNKPLTQKEIQEKWKKEQFKKENTKKTYNAKSKKKNKLLIPTISFFGVAIIVILFIWQPWVNPKGQFDKIEEEYNTEKESPIDIKFAQIEGGTFTMGSPTTEADRESDEVQHMVTLSDFKISKYEITFNQYDIFCNATGRIKPDDNGWGRGNRPVINVCWNDATAFCKWLSDKTGEVYRLPTEAEWEYACRAGTTTPYNTGNNLTTSQANYDGNYPYNGNAKGEYRSQTLPVGSFSPNAWGLYDMHGNVCEWCSDYYDTYSSNSQINPKGAFKEGNRVYRGGCWISNAQRCRSANRNGGSPDDSNKIIGFRLVLSP